MAGRIRGITGHSRDALISGWQLASCAPAGSIADLAAVDSLSWLPVDSLATVAGALRSRGTWDLDGPPVRFDASDWWYRLRLRPSRVANARQVLVFDGLATVCEAWLNGAPLLSSDSMFLEHEIDVTGRLTGDDEILLRFQSLDALLTKRRPRPLWRVPMLEHQQLRFWRTTLLGRTPGWSPPAAAVGPWRPIRLENRAHCTVSEVMLQTEVTDSDGLVHVSCRAEGLFATSIGSIELVVSRAGESHRTTLLARRSAATYEGTLRISEVALWWPHTHGDPAMYDARLEISADTLASGNRISVDCGRIGFRTMALDTRDGNFALSVNGIPIFCRGACWTPLDCVALHSSAQAYAEALQQVALAGINMLRVSGTMVYESDDFLDACDSFGMLLWQDFMFANMDYPRGDAAFAASVGREAEQLLQRFGGRPCLGVLCGNSEGEQQAAMWGAPRSQWEQPFFHHTLPAVAKRMAPAVPYWPSSAHGGAFPHQANMGTTSYYGVGAYRRPLADARLAQVRFATECLGFANIPEERTLAAIPSDGALKAHHPQWKARSPRDRSAGWDFDDIRDHYLGALFGTQALDLRYSDHDRYLELGRIVSGEAMAAAFRDWRRRESPCRGALVWFMRDLWPGAGWGIVDSLGTPKAAYHLLRRILQPQTLFLTDEGVNGVTAHIINEAGHPLSGSLDVSAFRSGRTLVGKGHREVNIDPRGALEVPIASLFDQFMDANHVYRFGPPICDEICATLTRADGSILARDASFPTGHSIAAQADVGLSGEARLLADGIVELSLQARQVARFVTIDAPGCNADDQFFHLFPGMPYAVRLRRPQIDSGFRAEIRASNSIASSRVTVAG
jgi:beta-mannosidase